MNDGLSAADGGQGLLDLGPDRALAYTMSAGLSPGVVFLHGLRSDQAGTKAMALEAHCRAAGRAFARFDMRGHGRSSRAFEEVGIADWAEDAVAVLDRLTDGPQVLVGSSMGGWIMLLAALARPDRVAGLVGIAAAPDFTEDLIWAQASAADRAALERGEVVEAPSEYDAEPLRIAPALIDQGRENLLLRGDPIPIRCPVRLLHGQKDEDVPWRTSLALAEALATDDVEVTLVKGADHRLSEPADLARLCATVDAACAAAGEGDR